MRKSREASLIAQTGWWLKIERIYLKSDHHPVHSIKGSFAISSYVAATPPGQEGRSTDPFQQLANELLTQIPSLDEFRSPGIVSEYGRPS